MRVLWATALVLLIDQVTKTIVVQTMRLYESIPIAGDLLKFTYTTNPGIAFGLTIGPQWLTSVFAIVATVVISVYLWSVRASLLSFRLSLALILGGALGNIVDRVSYGIIYGYGGLFRGQVVDFVHVDLYRGPVQLPLLGEFYLALFPIWNVADMAIVAGVVGYLVFHGRYQRDAEAQLEAHQRTLERTAPIPSPLVPPAPAERAPSPEDQAL
jgi:signal peptidase II